MSTPREKAVRARFAKAALTWFVPALLILPIYLVILGISVIAADVTLLEATEGVKGGINAAIGPLLILCGLVAVALTVVLGTDESHYINGAFFALGAIAIGAIISRQALDHLAKS